ncbi:hypothetical protein IGI37_002642 [Enterococcus sp. AZ194]|uniref:ABC transporter permease n=1 Tax=Enterococcus sp. AZ194 TaxID=2774629 RepID=UPI003F29D451
MRSLKRAALSVSKQFRRSGLLLLLFSVIISLLLVGFGIQKAVEVANKQAKQQMKAEMSIQPDYMKAYQDGKESVPQIDSDMVENIKNIPHVKKVIVDTKAYINNEYELYMTDQQKEMFANDNMQSMGLKEGQKEPKQYLYGISDKNQIEVFKKGQAFLVEGEFPYESKKQNPLLISKEVAELNKLKVGNTYKSNGGDLANKPIEYTVCGIFDYQDPAPAKEGNNNMMTFKHPMEEEKNLLYTTIDVAKKTMLLNNPKGKVQYESVKLVIDNVEEITGIQKYIKEKLEGEWDYMNFTSDFDQYEKMTAAINQVANIANMILVIGGIAGVVILTLILLLSFKDRIFEFGILLSLGESKVNIACQAVLEGLIILVVAFVLGIGISQPIADAASQSLLENQVQKVEEKKEDSEGNANEMVVIGGSHMDEQTEVKQIDKISVATKDVKTLGMTLVVSFCILLFSTVFPLALLFRKDPKVILLAKD